MISTHQRQILETITIGSYRINLVKRREKKDKWYTIEFANTEWDNYNGYHQKTRLAKLLNKSYITTIHGATWDFRNYKSAKESYLIAILSS